MSATDKVVPEQTSVTLATLCVAEANVRGDRPDPALPGLKASILARGVLAPLSVTAPPKGAKGAKAKYQVIAGGRRYRALRELANELKIGENYMVPVVVRPESDAAEIVEISLAENILREPLKPHEEYAAFARLADAGASEAAIAEHFGVSARRVGQLLRLGNLHPDLLAAFESGALKEEEARNFAATADQALQAKAWAAYQQIPSRSRYPHNINGLIAGKDSHTLNVQLRAVGRERYEAAGGRIEIDLFDDMDRARVLDPDILARLFAERKAQAFERLRDALPQIELVDEPIAYGVGSYVAAEREPLTGEALARVEALKARAAEIRAALDALCDAEGDLLNAEDEGKASALDDQLNDIDDAIETIEDTESGFTFPAVDGKLIARPRLDERTGRFMIDAHAVRHVPADWSPDNPTEFEAAATAGAPTPRESHISSEAAIKRDHGLSKTGIELMSAHRRNILQAAVLAGPVWAGDYLTFAIVRAVVGLGLAKRSGMAGAVVTDQALADHAELIAQPAHCIVDTLLGALDRSWIDTDDAADGYRQFVALPGEARFQWMRYAAGLILARSLAAPGHASAVHDALAAHIGLTDAAVRTYWTPDAAYWANLPRKHRLAALDALDPAIARDSQKLDNDGLTARCAAIFGEGDRALLTKIVSPEQAWKLAERAKSWVPPYLSFGVGAEAEADMVPGAAAEAA
jgi:ParB family chromosome partitioning protein